MKITFNASDLAALKPSLKAAKLAKHPVYCTLTADTSLIITILTVEPLHQVALAVPATVISPGSVSVDASSLLSSLPSSGEVAITYDNDRLAIKSDISTSYINTASHHHTALTADDIITTVSLPYQDMLKALSAVSFARSKEQVRPVLTGVLFEGNQTNIRFLATDGSRVISQRIPCGASANFRVVVPGSIADILQSLKLRGTAHIQISAKYITLMVDNFCITFRLLSETYFDVDQWLPSAYITEIIFTPKQLLTAVAPKLKTFGKNAYLKLSIRDTYCTLTSASECKQQHIEYGIHSKPTLGQDLDILFNAANFLELLKSLTSECTLKFTGQYGPALFTTDDANYWALLMPAR